MRSSLAQPALHPIFATPRLNEVPNAFPIPCMVDGKQYIAMPVGSPGLQGNTAL